MQSNKSNMFTAKIISKEVEESTGLLVLSVAFSDGTKTIVETVKPQDKEGLNYWVEARCKSLNTSKELQLEDNVNKPIDVSKPEPVVTNEQKYQEARFKLIESKRDLDLGLLSEEAYAVELAKVIALKVTK